MKTNKIIIVGCGPAGIACAIQLKRMGLEPLVIEKKAPGGMLINANRIENYPGFPGGIPGDLLANLIVEQYRSFEIETVIDEIKELDFSDSMFHLKGSIGEYSCGVVVIATGTMPKMPAEISEEILKCTLVHFDISFLRSVSHKTIGIIGAGDAAFDYGLTLSENQNKVLIFNRSNQIKALKALQEKVFINNNIKYFENYRLTDLEIIDNKSLNAFFNSASANSNYSLDYLIFATGRIPEDGFFRESLKGYIPNLLKEKRLYLAGDIANDHYRQVSVAVGQGIRTAMEIFRHESY